MRIRIVLALQKLHKYAIKNKYLRQLIFEKYIFETLSQLWTPCPSGSVSLREKYVTASLVIVMVAVYQSVQTM